MPAWRGCPTTSVLGTLGVPCSAVCSTLVLQPWGFYERAWAARAPQPQSCGQTAPGQQRQQHQQRHWQGCAGYQPPCRVHLSIRHGDCTEAGPWHEDRANGFRLPSCIETGALGSDGTLTFSRFAQRRQHLSRMGRGTASTLAQPKMSCRRDRREITACKLLPRRIVALMTW